MRKVRRLDLPLDTRLALHRRQKTVVNAADARTKWVQFRGTAAASSVVEVLRRMAGVRGRCFYCSDSLGVDVEHYKPMAIAPELAFVWRNHQWVCAACNRKKGARFPMRGDLPLLINPSETEPWRHLVYVEPTGLIAPRFGPLEPDEVGLTTLGVLDHLNYEAISNGRQRVARRLRRAAAAVSAAAGSREPRERLFGEILEDDYGISAWYFAYEGQASEPFATVRARDPRLWRRLIKAAVTNSDDPEVEGD